MDSQLLQLAHMLGVGAQELIGYYVQRIPGLVMAAYISGGITVLLSIILIGSALLADDCDKTGWIVGLVFVLITGGIITGTSAYDAYLAKLAPQAYAVDHILRAIGK